MIRRRVVVHGFVQGVGFRYSARLEAERLGISGRVRNRADGSVEVEVEGDAASVQGMIDWLVVGPPGAHVRSTEVTDAEPTGERGFRIAF